MSNPHIQVRVLAKTQFEDNGPVITTFELEYPRYIHAEFLTHRMLSRNSQSSRAVPIQICIDKVMNDPVIPSEFLANKPGMQGGDPLPDADQKHARLEWTNAAHEVAKAASNLLKFGVHKQFANRILEPFLTIKTVVTATDWDNFYSLRIHPDAQPEIHELALRMKEAQDAFPTRRGEFHLPYVDLDIVEKAEAAYHELYDPSRLSVCFKAQMISAARCARVSYAKFDGVNKVSDEASDLQLAKKLYDSKHLSPFEHQACGQREIEGEFHHTYHDRYSNFHGWQSFRDELCYEAHDDYLMLL